MAGNRKILVIFAAIFGAILAFICIFSAFMPGIDTESVSQDVREIPNQDAGANDRSEPPFAETSDPPQTENPGREITYGKLRWQPREPLQKKPVREPTAYERDQNLVKPRDNSDMAMK